jgi:hypothetical protein
VRPASRGPIVALLSWAVGCSSPPSELSALRTKAVYGRDDRIELFEAEDLARTLSASTVALGLRNEIEIVSPGVLSVLSPSWGQRARLCEHERFAEQPSFAVCTGVAIGTDLVLTAAHCTRAAALEALVVVTGYSYEAPGQLALDGKGQLLAVRALLTSDSYWDYAWLRVDAGLSPLPAERRVRTDVVDGAGVVSVNHGGGLPAKVDRGGVAYPLNADQLVTTLDALGGASGAPVFSTSGNLIGVLSAGSADYVQTASDCVTIATSPDEPDTANELVVRLHVAVNALCEASTTDAAIEALCTDQVPSDEYSEPASCSMTPAQSGSGVRLWGMLLIAIVFARRASRLTLGLSGTRFGP